jgi:RNA polymerase sigma-70 factor (ECF subfamily)
VSTDRVEDAYRRIHARLWRSLAVFCGDADMASDAEAEAFAQALRRGDAVESVDAWVWATAFRVAKGLLADRSALLNREIGFELVDQQHGIHDIEFLDQLRQLTDQQRAVVVLRYVGRLKPREIAAVLGTSSGSVRVQLHRSHAILRAELEQAHG